MTAEPWVSVEHLAPHQDLYAPLVDAWALYDNAGAKPVLKDWSEKP